MIEELPALLEMAGVTPAQLEFLQTFFVISIVLTLIALVLTPLVARYRQLDAGFWMLMVLLFGPFAFVAVFFAPQKKTLSESLA